MRRRCLILCYTVALGTQVAVGQQSLPASGNAVSELDLKALNIDSVTVLPARCMRIGAFQVPSGPETTNTFWGMGFAPLLGPIPVRNSYLNPFAGHNAYRCQDSMRVDSSGFDLTFVSGPSVFESAAEVVEAKSLVNAFRNVIAILEEHSSEEIKKQFSELNKQILESEMVENITAEVSTSIAAQFEAKLRDLEVEIRELKEQLRRKEQP